MRAPVTIPDDGRSNKVPWTGHGQAITPLRRKATYPTPGTHPCSLAHNGSGMGCSDADSERIIFVSKDGEAVRDIDCTELKSSQTFEGGLLGHVSAARRRLIGMDRSGKIQRKVPPPSPANEPACTVAMKEGGVNLAIKKLGEIHVEDLAVGRQLRTLRGCPLPGDLTFAGDALWLATAHEGQLIRIDLSTGSRDPFHVGNCPTGIAFDGRALSVNDHGTWRIGRYELVPST